MLVDTHCHLNFTAFDDDRQAALERAAEQGVRYVLNPGIDLDTSRAAVALADRYPALYVAVGVHPNDATSWADDSLDELRQLAQHPKVVAIGEIGLDYYREYAPHDLQQRILRQQLELAGELGLPVVIHTRNRSEQERSAIQDALEILGEWQAQLASHASGSAERSSAQHCPLAENPGVLHSFSGNLQEAEKAFAHNFRIGITGPVTFRKADGLREVVAQAPLERLLVETDAPFLTPHPHRGQRNEPAYVRFVAEKISELHNLPFETVAGITTNSAGRLFNWRITL